MSDNVRIAYHLGVTHTDNDQLIWSLRADAKMLSTLGVQVPRPKLYRAAVESVLADFRTGSPPPETQRELMAAITGRANPARVLLSNSNFLAYPGFIFNGAELYRKATRKAAQLRKLFPENGCEFLISIRNLATFVPDVFSASKHKDYRDFLQEADLPASRWSDVIARIQDANPDVPITVWCNEDTPVLWPTVLRRAAGIGNETALTGDMNILNKLISDEGKTRLQDYFLERPDLSLSQRQRVMEIFFEKFAQEDALEVEIDLPGWSHDFVAQLDENYERDVSEIERMDGVTMLLP